MVWTAVFGLTEVVSKQFEKLYPRYQTKNIYRGNSIYLAHALTRNIVRDTHRILELEVTEAEVLDRKCEFC